MLQNEKIFSFFFVFTDQSMNSTGMYDLLSSRDLVPSDCWEAPMIPDNRIFTSYTRISVNITYTYHVAQKAFC